MKKLRFVLNTEPRGTVTTYVFIDYLSKLLDKNGYPVTVGDWKNYGSYDVALFVNKPKNLDEVRRGNPDIVVGICDPKSRDFEGDVTKVDFVTASSIEHRQLLLAYNKNVFIYPVHRPMEARTKKASDNEKLIIAYQGNKVHLLTMAPNIIAALEWLGNDYKVEFWALYDIKNLGKWETVVPHSDKVTVRHIQWEADTYCDYLWRADIGIVPNFLPIRKPDKVKRVASLAPALFLEDKYDYIVRYKYTSNTNRLYEFSQLGVPVVADMYPSACTLIRDRYSGFVAYTAEGWYSALKELAVSPELRDYCAENLRKRMNEFYTPESNFKKFLEFIEYVIQEKKNGISARSPHVLTNSERNKVIKRIYLFAGYEQVKRQFKKYPAAMLRKINR